MSKGSRNWARVNVSLSSDDAVYLIGLIGSDIGAMISSKGDYDVVLQRARRTRQKLQDALKGRDDGTSKNEAIAVSD